MLTLSQDKEDRPKPICEIKEVAITLIFEADGYQKEEMKFTYYADLRYAGQEHYVKKCYFPNFLKNL